jgi:UDP-N-acetylmuramoyl-L-alanyl-D-glutamate--2,6-diaminopimelate ligase
MTAPSVSVDLAALVAALADARVEGTAAGSVHAIVHDSRAVAPGDVFVALRGTQRDGHDFVDRARERGALAVVVDRAYASTSAVATDAAVGTIVVPDTQLALSRLAAAFYGRPARAMRVAGVTGTNGKTTTTQVLATMLTAAGIATGIIGTLGARLGDERWPLENTTPLALELQALLAAMRERGARAVAMEVSSHALAQGRVADVPFAVAALTNVTRDHLDFHGDMASYAAAKRSLFDQTEHAVLNADDAYGARWAAELRARELPVTTYGFAADADLRATDVVMRADGSRFTLDGRTFETQLPGRFNVENALAAIAMARVLGASDAHCADALANFERVPGRMEHFGRGGIDVLVDYAHTPDALDAVLRAARETVRGELVVVFGCGGDRDRGKRPQMGRIATERADRVYVTSDNPRSEDPQTIVDEIVSGIADRARVRVVLDRRLAIAEAVAAARAGDVIVVAGKGHETYQLAAGQTHHFDDREEVRRALAMRDEAPA